MKRAVVFILFYLVAAEALEFAVLPQIQGALHPSSYEALFDLRLLASAGILAGLLLGEWAGLLTALIAALLAGFSQAAGQLGASLVGFTLAAWLAGRMARPLRWQGLGLRGPVLYILLMIALLVWAAVRKLFWPATAVEIPWLGLLVTAVLAALLDAFVARRLRPRKGMSSDEDWSGAI
jgi:hypothetical protein